MAHERAGYPTWLRSARQYENFDFRGEFFVKGWMNSGIYLHAPEHGRAMWAGMKINIFHQVEQAAAIAPKLKSKPDVLQPSLFTAYSSIALGSALALFLYPHSLTGVFLASGPRGISPHASSRPTAWC